MTDSSTELPVSISRMFSKPHSGILCLAFVPLLAFFQHEKIEKNLPRVPVAKINKNSWHLVCQQLIGQGDHRGTLLQLLLVL